MRVLILGSTGQLGSSLDNLLSFNAAYERICPTREILDLNNVAEIYPYVTGVNPGLIINCAAYADVDSAERNFFNAEKINSIAVQKLVQSANFLGVPLIHFSTDYVFDGTKEAPYTEEDEPRPINMYGKTKLDGDLYIQSECKQYLIFRTSWLYGPGKNFPRTIRTVVEKIRAEKLKKSISVVCDQIGSPTNSEDVAYTVLHFIKKKLVHGRQELFNLSSLGRCSWYDFALFIAKVHNITDIKFTPIPAAHYISAAKRPKFSALDCTKILSEKIRLPNWEYAYEQSSLCRQNF